MSKKIEFFEIEDEIYHKNFHLVVNVSKKRFEKWVSKYHKDKIVLHDSKAAVLWDYDPYYYVWLESFDWSIEDQGVMVHELNHFVDFVLSNAGISIGKKNTEVRAYYFEYIFKKVYTVLKPIYGKKSPEQ